MHGDSAHREADGGAGVDSHVDSALSSGVTGDEAHLPVCLSMHVPLDYAHVPVQGRHKLPANKFAQTLNPRAHGCAHAYTRICAHIRAHRMSTHTSANMPSHGHWATKQLPAMLQAITIFAITIFAIAI